MDADAHRQSSVLVLRQTGVQRPHGLENAQAAPHRPLGIVFVRLRIAKVDQQPVAQILRDVPLKSGDHLGTGRLIGPHHLAPVFGVELAGEHGRVHQITEQHRELTAFGLSGTRGGSWRATLGRSLFQRFSHLRWYSGL
jgi:hypothetical protein